MDSVTRARSPLFLLPLPPQPPPASLHLVVLSFGTFSLFLPGAYPYTSTYLALLRFRFRILKSFRMIISKALSLPQDREIRDSPYSSLFYVILAAETTALSIGIKSQLQLVYTYEIFSCSVGRAQPYLKRFEKRGSKRKDDFTV